MEKLGAAAARHDSGTTLKREAVAADAPCAPGKTVTAGLDGSPSHSLHGKSRAQRHDGFA